jgi:membrane glycosyltransferase
MQNCDLPFLPGRKPFGGQILSHDFVEAALMLKENWQVWLAHELDGSYEEAPQDLITNAQRDRRWCQGNLQHGMVLFARGLRSTSRMHLLMGIFGYLASPLWLLFMLTYVWIRLFWEYTNLTIIPGVSQLAWLQDINPTAHAFLVFTICMGVLMLPKVLVLIDLSRDFKRQREFGSLANAWVGAMAETLFSTLHAPLQMLWHTQFVISNLLGTSVNWATQQRNADGTAWLYALRSQWWQMLIGVAWGGMIFWFDRSAFWWFAPVLLGMALAVPLSVLTSRANLGERARDAGLFLTPEETTPPIELISLHDRMTMLEIRGEAESRPHNFGVADAVLDPYVNAIHVTLLREKNLNPQFAEALANLGVGQPLVRELGEKLLREGPEKLSTKEKLLVLSDATVMLWLHHQAWLRPPQELASWWQPAIRRYARG